MKKKVAEMSLLLWLLLWFFFIVALDIAVVVMVVIVAVIIAVIVVVVVFLKAITTFSSEDSRDEARYWTSCGVGWVIPFSKIRTRTHLIRVRSHMLTCDHESDALTSEVGMLEPTNAFAQQGMTNIYWSYMATPTDCYVPLVAIQFWQQI